MRQIPYKDLPNGTQTYLDKLQQKVMVGTSADTNTSFEAQVRRAGDRWKPVNKKFDVIKKTLQQMTVVGSCNYCESDRAVDIEHIYPKSKFPERAYSWSNYLLACSNCNSYLKIDKFAIFSPPGSNLKEDLKREDKSKPATDDGLLINPREENPQSVLRLNLTSKTFLFDPTDFDAASRNHQRAKYTTELLTLNDELLRKAREAKATELVGYLRKYVEVSAANTYEELKKIPDYPIEIDQNSPFEQEKERIKLAYKSRIIHSNHFTVWDELKRQRQYLPKVNRYFDAVPETLIW